MKEVIYQGLRNGNGAGSQLVMRNDDIFSPEPSQKLRNHSPDGFNWGYCGSGPAQLALALLLDATQGEGVSARFYQEFKFEFVANWDDDWSITKSEILEWVREHVQKPISINEN